MAVLPEGTVELIAAALAEDLGSGDVTAEATIPAEIEARGRIVQKQPGVVFGLDLVEEVFRQVGVTDIDRAVVEGHWHESVPRDVLLMRGGARDLLAGERVALNFLWHLSGIATLTARYVDAVAGTGTRILDTRKTTPGLRALEKQAVSWGGGVNHRIGLYDAILIKENHVAMAGGIGPAIAACRAHRPGMLVEVETEDLDEVVDAIEAGADRIMLDDMDQATMMKAVELRDSDNGGIELEASGGVNLENVRGIADTGVDFISIGALTHSAPQLDLSMLVEPVDRPAAAGA